jgi:fucose permease
MKSLAGIVALLAVFTLAIDFILIGSISEEIKARLKIDNAQVGSLASALFLTSLAVQLVVGVLVDRLGHRTMAIAGFLASGAAVFLLATADQMNTALVACGLLGIGAMCVNTVGNTLIPIVLFDGKDPARASNLGNGFVGLAFILTPLALHSLMKDLGLGYGLALSSVAALILGFALITPFATYPQVRTGYRLSEAVGLLRDPPVLAAGAALLCYIALEISLNTWIKPFIAEIYAATGSTDGVTYATWVLSLFGLAIAVGRFATSTVRRLSAVGTRLIAVLALVTAGAVVAMSLTRQPWLAAAAVAVAGLALAPLFPTIVGVTFAQYDPGKYGSVFGIIFAIGLLGPTLLPKLIGELSVGLGVQKSLLAAAAIATILCACAFVMEKVRRPGATSSTPPRTEQATIVSS